MKKILGMLFATGLLLACNSGNNKDKSTTSSPSAVNHSKHADNGSGLVLNNGAKWKADSVTNHNVVDLRSIADNFRMLPFPSAGEYQMLGNDLNNALNKMIKECKMYGPDHDALHQWLEPVLKETNELKNISDTSVARKTFKDIDQRIDHYHNYFE